MDAQDVSLEVKKSHRDGVFIVRPDTALQQLRLSKQWTALCALHRVNALSCCKAAEHGWPAGSFSCIELLTVAHNIFGRGPYVPVNEVVGGESGRGGGIMARGRVGIDKVVLAKGHAAAAQYAVLLANDAPDRVWEPLVNDDGTGSVLKTYKDGTLSSSGNLKSTSGGGLRHLEAHADMHCDTGSLGQCLSMVAGMAAAAPLKTFCVLLGDGEMQEGQNFEALMSIRHFGLKNILIVIDYNAFQSDQRVSDTMPIWNWCSMLRGFGFEMVTIEDGHNIRDVAYAFKTVLRKMRNGEGLFVIVAKTVKGGGTAFMPTEPHPISRHEVQPWHTRIPTWERYKQIVDEQLNIATQAVATTHNRDAVTAVARVREQWAQHQSAYMIMKLPLTIRKVPRVGAVGTGAAFGRRLCEAHALDNRIAIISADLSTSCGISAAMTRRRFYEMGICEQNAVSFAAGLTLQTKSQSSSPLSLLPVVCTYSVFLKRAAEQIITNALQGAHMFYAGHYSGLCYHTDGKSHQSLNDISFFLAVPRMVCVDPINAVHAARCFEYCSDAFFSNGERQQRRVSFYFRLRRTPIDVLDHVVFSSVLPGKPMPTPLEPRLVLAPGLSHKLSSSSMDPAGSQPPPDLILCMGTVSTFAALECQQKLETWSRCKIIVVPCLALPSSGGGGVVGTGKAIPSEESWRDIIELLRQSALERCGNAASSPPAGGDSGGVLVVEDDFGTPLSRAFTAALCSFSSSSSSSSEKEMDRLRRSNNNAYRVVSKRVVSQGPSLRTFVDALQWFGYMPHQLRQLWEDDETSATASLHYSKAHL